MKRSMRFLMALGAAALLQAGSADAASIVGIELRNRPAGGAFAVGDVLEFQLHYDFSDRKSFGGGIEVDFDETQLELVEFSFDNRWPFNPARPEDSFNRPLGFFAENRSLLAIGDFNPFGDKGIIAVLKLRAISIGNGLLLPASNELPAGPFIGEDFNPLDVTFEGAAYSIAVPEPGTLLLLGAGLAGLARSRRRTA
jgi:hypothetical protein